MHKRNGLTALRVKRKDKPGRYGDGGGLYLAVNENGAKSWVFMWKRGGKRHARGLGSVADLSLVEAREAAAEARKAVREGRDPRAARAGIVTFGQVADELFETLSPKWRNAKHRYQWQRALELHCKPLRDKPVAEIGTEYVLGVLKPLWATTPVTAARTRERIEQVLDAAKAKGHRTGDNPARWKGNLEHLLPKRRNVVTHLKAIPYPDVPPFMAKLRASEGAGCSALEFAVLTAARPGEVLGAKWPEIDLEGKVWTIPAARMKGEREHRVPLSPRCVTILRQMLKARVSDYVFPGERADRPVASNTLRVILGRLGADATVHGFRSAFRDWCGDRTSFPREVAEASLAHRVGDDTERAYRRGDAFEKRALLMQHWASYCEPKAGNVVAIRRRGGK
jgi:integrase